MLVSVAIVPGPPAFVAELMGSAAHELDDLRHAAESVISEAISDLVAASADSSLPDVDSAQLVIVGPGQPGEFNAGGPVSFASFGRDVVVPALSDRGDRGDGGDRGDRGAADHQPLPTPLMVARHLASRDVATHPEHAHLWESARWITTSGDDATALGDKLREGGTHVALILVADGATCHGPKAPRAEDSRAPAYEDEVCTALASGQPDLLAQVDDELGRELGATGLHLWPVLLAASTGDWAGELTYRAAPYGVGWAVAAWRRPTLSNPVART
jgi:hypothetical protein